MALQQSHAISISKVCCCCRRGFDRLSVFPSATPLFISYAPYDEGSSSP
jgi:hypothetical protein